jgi:hypothetical protein
MEDAMDGALPESHYPDSNYHIAPGDILLLSSRGARGRGTLLQQAIDRRGSRRFRHIAVVLNDKMVAEAMPRHGVTLRHWQDLLDHVDLASSRVARNRKLAHDPDAGPRIMQRANLFYKQRYDVQAVVRSDLEDDAPPCCQFVGALYDDLELQQGEDWTRAIASHTRDGAWRQFKLSEYGLALPQHPLSASFYLNHFDDTFSAKVPPALVQHLRTQRAASQFAANQRELALAIAAMPRQLDPLRDALRAVSPAHADEPPLGGGTLEAQWRHLFLDYRPGIPGFLHTQGAAGDHLPQLRRYARATGELLSLAHLLHSALAMFQETAAMAHQLTRQGKAGIVQMEMLCSQGEQLLACCAALCDDEQEDEVLMRVQNYPVLHADAEDMPDLEVAALGTSSLVALSELDLLRLNWVGSAKPALQRTLPRLRDILELLR